MVKENVVYIDKGVLFIHKNEGNSAICDNMGEPGGHYAKWNKSYRDKYSSMVTIVNNIVLYTWNLLRVDLTCSHHTRETGVNHVR